MTFSVTHTHTGNSRQSVALILNLSGTIDEQDLPEKILLSHHVYSIAPVLPAEPGPTLISSATDLTSFEGVMRKFLAAIEADHGRVDAIDLFPAVSVSAAVTLGRLHAPHLARLEHPRSR